MKQLDVVLADATTAAAVDIWVKKMAPPLVTLLSAEPEVQYVALRNINLIVQKRPKILAHEVKVRGLGFIGYGGCQVQAALLSSKQDAALHNSKRSAEKKQQILGHEICCWGWQLAKGIEHEVPLEGLVCTGWQVQSYGCLCTSCELTRVCAAAPGAHKYWFQYTATAVWAPYVPSFN